MTTQTELAQLFTRLHVKGNPLILFNIWDAGSAKAVQEVGAKAIATGSWAVAAAHGYSDGEKLPFEVALSTLREIAASVDLPVTLDMESGYGRTPAQLQANIQRVIAAGAVGINFEDQIINGEGLYSVEEQSARIKAIRQAAGIPLFINARTDIFLIHNPANEGHLEEAIQRAHAYAEAGASGFFAPGLRDARSIQKLCEVSPLPVNILVLANTPSPQELAALGAARISYGAGPYRQMIAALKEAGRKALEPFNL